MKSEFRKLRGDFEEWRKARGFYDDLRPDEAYDLAERCSMHLRCLELNMPDPGPILIGAALADLHKLEAMLSRSEL